jgi:plastocyanin
MRSHQKNRRDFLKTAGVVGGIVTGFGFPLFSSSVSGQEEYAETFELLGRTSGWVGISPSDIADETNPTLRLASVGETYRVIWENDDGAPHNFHLITADGETVTQTDIISSGSQEIVFEAIEELAGGRYQCDPHSGRMVGDVEIEGVEPPESGDEETETEADGEETETDDEETETEADDEETPTDQPDDEETETDGGGTTDGFGSGFGIVAALAGLGAGVAAAMKRLSGKSDRSQK